MLPSPPRRSSRRSRRRPPTMIPPRRLSAHIRCRTSDGGRAAVAVGCPRRGLPGKRGPASGRRHRPAGVIRPAVEHTYGGSRIAPCRVSTAGCAVDPARPRGTPRPITSATHPRASASRHDRAMAHVGAGLTSITHSAQASPCTTAGSASDRRQSRASRAQRGRGHVPRAADERIYREAGRSWLHHARILRS